MWSRRLATVAALIALPAPALALMPASAAGSVPTGNVTFSLKDAPAVPYALNLKCGGRPVARTKLMTPDRREATVPLRMKGAADRDCTVEVITNRARGHVNEMKVTVRQGGDVWARDTLYTPHKKAETRPFTLPKQDATIELAAASLPENQAGTPLRLMAWNLWVGATLNRQDTTPTGENLTQAIEYLNEVEPDVLFVVEGYGSGTKVLDGLNAGRPANDRYTGVQITQQPDYSANGDNLWLYTKLKVEKVYPRTAEPDLSSFNFGGAKLRLPDGKHVHAFSMWMWHLSYAYGDTHAAAVENIHGFPRTKTNEQIVAGDYERRMAMGRTLFEKALPAYIGNDDAPVLLGGDLNAWSHLDWTQQFANARGHGGLVLEWPLTKLFTDNGFTDAFRYANPDAARYPGRSWSPVSGYGAVPARIDYIFTRGRDVEVLGSRTDVRRLPRHQGISLDPAFPFYSDHGAVVSDILIRGSGTGQQRPVVAETPENAPGVWPAPPAGTRVPPAELSATASTFKPGVGDPKNAVDGNLQTDYHSDYPVIAPQPHTITVDLGRVRQLSAVRFQPKLRVNMNGTILKGVVQVSEDGTDFTDVKRVEWPRMTAPNDVDMNGVRARYVRLRADYGMGGASALAEIIPYEVPQS
ncbi:discoidin domain-containing protein [Sinosporangium siamense]|uniref:discoidin domain-containing protein n=1 Tax=Sinosporangium siamense TaxID=1367973 RepID=UPI0035EF2846